MGIHVGKCEAENTPEGLRYSGKCMKIFEEIAKAANGGQILVSSQVLHALDMKTALHYVAYDLGMHLLSDRSAVFKTLTCFCFDNFLFAFVRILGNLRQ